MSARRRQETLERFSVPIEDEASSDMTTETLPSKRRRRSSKQLVTQNEDSFDVDGDSDADFTMNGVDDDDDFLDDDDDDCAFSSKQKAKGKAKAKNKGKVKSFSRGNKLSAFNSSSFAGENPKAMLISLKARSPRLEPHSREQCLPVRPCACALSFNLTSCSLQYGPVSVLTISTACDLLTVLLITKSVGGK